VDLYKQTLTIALAQHHAIDFLTWFRDHGAGGCAHCVADGVERECPINGSGSLPVVAGVIPAGCGGAVAGSLPDHTSVVS
ncbi:hypothetical protein, partial [Nocardia farcinica]|uniref:hypothetical protein n=1 Tax=Nocardia farcinica TaxID=37329 RepID=UPI001E33AF7D